MPTSARSVPGGSSVSLSRTTRYGVGAAGSAGVAMKTLPGSPARQAMSCSTLPRFRSQPIQQHSLSLH